MPHRSQEQPISENVASSSTAIGWHSEARPYSRLGALQPVPDLCQPPQRAEFPGLCHFKRVEVLSCCPVTQGPIFLAAVFNSMIFHGQPMVYRHLTSVKLNDLTIQFRKSE
ncbi:hypothetical protein CTS44_15458 [Comamonas thiooxydans]|nr:hypothetical protein CTS44_15458 [Comamonas thiooxydans]